MDKELKIEVMRATEEWQRTGAYSVRIEGMNREHHISLREEFDDLDGDQSKYIVILDDGYPVGTCRFFDQTMAEIHSPEAAKAAISVVQTEDHGNQKQPAKGHTAQIGRVVVLPEYRGYKLGALVIQEAEKWIRELGYSEIIVDSRTVAVGFYEKLGFEVVSDSVYISGPFECVYMRKQL